MCKCHKNVKFSVLEPYFITLSLPQILKGYNIAHMAQHTIFTISFSQRQSKTNHNIKQIITLLLVIDNTYRCLPIDCFILIKETCERQKKLSLVSNLRDE